MAIDSKLFDEFDMSKLDNYTLEEIIELVKQGKKL